jgi:C-terminal processing protease CtpA/Prc
MVPVFVSLVATTLLTPGPAPAQNVTPPKAASRFPPKAQYQPPQAQYQIVTDADSSTNLVNEVLVGGLKEPADELLGATLQPVGDTLRAQLAIPAGQGLLVAALRADGPAAQAGLKQNDVLLTLADKNLAAADDLSKQLKAAGEAAVRLKLLRAGKPLTVQVRPVYRVTIGPANGPKMEFYIGVNIEPADDALRAQLGLTGGQGVVIGDVLAGSPAEKAGVLKHDVVLEMGGKAVDSPESLAKQVQATGEKPTELKVLRGGKPVTIPVTPTVRVAEAAAAQETLRLWLTDLEGANAERKAVAAWRLADDDVRARIDRLEKELQAIRAALDKINETLKSDKKRD